MKLKNPVLLSLCSVHGTDVKSGNILLPDLVKVWGRERQKEEAASVKLTRVVLGRTGCR